MYPKQIERTLIVDTLERRPSCSKTVLEGLATLVAFFESRDPGTSLPARERRNVAIAHAWVDQMTRFRERRIENRRRTLVPAAARAT